MKNCFILTCNVGLEFEKTEVNSQFLVEDPKKRQDLIEAERKTVDDKVKQIIALKKKKKYVIQKIKILLLLIKKELTQ